MDIWYDQAARLRHRNRYLPIDYVIVEPASLAVTVNSDDSSFGFTFSNPAEDEAVAALGCAVDDGSFQWWWVEVGLCLRSDLEGQRILIEVE